MIGPDTEVVTYRPDGSDPQALNQLGYTSGLRYSWVAPGGCDVLSVTLKKTSRWRTNALNPGRLVSAFRGGQECWAGRLDEPTPGAEGWQLQAHGAGAFGNDYRAIWSGTWGTSTPDLIVNNAIGRGLDWVNPGIGSPSGMFIGQKVDSGSETVTDALNMVCNKGGLTWLVVTTPAGNTLNVVSLPTSANRLLYATSPVARSITGSPNALYVRYQTAWDTTKNPATYALTSSTTPADITAHGRSEDFMDISSAGVYSTGAAQGVASNTLQRYQRSAFTDAFTVRPGELQNLGGQAVDLGCFYTGNLTGMVCRVLLADFGYGGEITPGPVTFLVGSYEYDQDSNAATVTPFERLRHNWSSLLSLATESVPVRTQPHRRRKRVTHH